MLHYKVLQQMPDPGQFGAKERHSAALLQQNQQQCKVVACIISSISQVF